MAFVSSSLNNFNSSNGVNSAQGVNTVNGVNTASSQVNAASSLNIDNLSDTVICDFLAPMGHDNKSRDVTRKTVPVETPNSSALVSYDGLGGYDWSDQAKEGLTNYALMAYFTLSASSLDSKLIDLRKSEIIVVAYKEGLKFIEQRLEFFKTNESKYIEQINVLKINIHYKDRALTELQMKLKLAETKKEGIQLNVSKLENASKSLNKIIECQIVDNCKKGLGYNAIPSPHIGLFPPLKSDLSYTRLEELFNEPKTKKSKDKSTNVEPKSVRKDSDALIIEDWVSDDEEETVEKQEVKPSINKINFVKATTDNNPRETVQYVVNAAKAKAKHKAVKGKRGNAVKALACWVWKPKHNVLDHVSKYSGTSITLKKFDYVDAQGRSKKHVFFINYEEINGGYVAFEGNPKRGKITGKEGTSCLSNVVIVKELARTGAQTTSWNEFSSTMASAIICLANNQKFNFSKYILISLVKNLEAGVPSNMFPWFIQVFMNHQLGDMSHYKGIFVNPSLTKKVFANMKKVGTGFFGAVTPLFGIMMRKHEPKKKEKKEIEVSLTEIHIEDHVPTTSIDPLHSGEDRMQLKELIDLCTNLLNKVNRDEIFSQSKDYRAREQGGEGRKITDIDADAEVNLENVYNLDMAREETVLSMQDVNVQSERINADVKEVAEEMFEESLHQQLEHDLLHLPCFFPSSFLTSGCSALSYEVTHLMTVEALNF
nr:hypothetical protein [Tanacetum cinerariifolium]